LNISGIGVKGCRKQRNKGGYIKDPSECFILATWNAQSPSIMSVLETFVHFSKNINDVIYCYHGILPLNYMSIFLTLLTHKRNSLTVGINFRNIWTFELTALNNRHIWGYSHALDILIRCFIRISDLQLATKNQKTPVRRRDWLIDS